MSKLVSVYFVKKIFFCELKEKQHVFELHLLGNQTMDTLELVNKRRKQT